MKENSGSAMRHCLNTLSRTVGAAIFPGKCANLDTFQPIAKKTD